MAVSATPSQGRIWKKNGFVQKVFDASNSVPGIESPPSGLGMGTRIPTQYACP